MKYPVNAAAPASSPIVRGEPQGWLLVCATA
jgi:hypothetical protein